MRYKYRILFSFFSILSVCLFAAKNSYPWGEWRSFASEIGPVYSLKYSPDGKYFASAGMDKDIKIWKIDRQRPIYTLKGHTMVVTSIDFSPDGKHLVSSSLDRSVKIWSLKNRLEEKNLQFYIKSSVLSGPENTQKHLDSVEWVGYSPDGKYLAAIAPGGVKIWLASNYKEYLNIPYTIDVLPCSASFSPDGKYLAVGSRDGIIRIWELKTGEELENWYCADKTKPIVCYGKKSQYFASSASEGTVKVWLLQDNYKKMDHSFICLSNGMQKSYSLLVFQSKMQFVSLCVWQCREIVVFELWYSNL